MGLAWGGLSVVATDLPGSRFGLLQQNLQRTCPQGEARALERTQALGDRRYDLVWVDAPCSGSGILRRHPDVRWLREEKDLSSLVQLQRTLLQEAAGHVKPGGFLMYSVCSVLKEEGEDLVRNAGLQGFTLRWEKLLAPQDEPGGDGFWGCLLERSR